MRVTGLHHIGISVEDLDSAIEQYRKLLGAEAGDIYFGGSGAMKASFLNMGDFSIELTQPLSQKSHSSKIVAEKGYGISHMALKVDELDQAVTELRSQWVELMGEPWTTSFGKKAVFTDAGSLGGVNLELLGE